MAADTVTIERVVAGGAGLARGGDGRVVFVDGALPGEVVVARTVERRRDYASAVVDEVLEASAARVAPPCPHLAEGCGGCSWQHVGPAAQLQFKVDIVRDALRRTAGLPDAVVRAAGAVPSWGYRTGLRLAIAGDGRLGLRRAASHEVVGLDDCPVAHPALSRLIGEIRAEGVGEVALRVSAATGAATAMAMAAVTRGRGRRGPRTAAPRLVAVPDGVDAGAGAHVHEDVAGVRLRVSAASFFQSGPAAAELLVAAVGAALGDGVEAGDRGDRGVLVDAYGGVGLFAATVGSTFGEVVVVESSPSACADVWVNLGGRRATVVEAHMEQWPPRRADVVVADPARSGLQRSGAAAVAATGARRIVLVSCDPVSLARDAHLLVGDGYELRDSAVLDLFPHTPHAEVVSVFDRVG